ncbi:TPA: MurR/RpiR family transcriptional regulator [Yersinia enterocolitica]|uniref:Sialic acid utilization regulator, RpiR family n=2 Tax=Yersinia enterocolitica TaxID=630 RepID=A0A0H3NSU5_YERE1|nr:MurR/RpiR family transcriptional regulator [Yersinia enterocolitica]EHB21634.1 putative DNA-binding transcriptional regulator [Yersinia enterocolitica subsp. palearctica PhRBD_Ye1]EKN3314058.1 MurR/RpiR family transcriptional regulator [Yersinia enterocolitica]EKN3319717.1 MurR/RpiR family transcriptional regulator [Yersinia enterocolitica]EKN3321116.1 MurR/RpiR family transcriptional regulator [Yersinia enterocolitica]EKN3333255.1 MurR/RpiR family transcriptional regulator [Yersinia entero
MSSLLRIRQLYPTLAQNDRKLADFLLINPEQARHLSSQKLAQQTGVSQSAVVKFAQKLGYKGFPALKQALSEIVAAPEQAVTLHNQILSTDSLKTVGEKLLAEKAAALRATLDINSEQRLTEALDMLRSARRVILTGLGASGLVAKDLAYKLLKIGVMAVSETDMHAQLAAVQALDSRDLLLAISFSGERREINLAAEEAQRCGAKVLALTSFTPNSLQQRADHCLYTISEEPAIRSAAISSSTAQYALTDLLFMAMIQQDLESAQDHINHSAALVKKLV